MEITPSKGSILDGIQQPRLLIFEAQKINVITNYTGTHVGVLIGASLKDARTGKEVWSGSYGLVAIKNPITGRKFAAPQVKEMLTSALKSISS